MDGAPASPPPAAHALAAQTTYRPASPALLRRHGRGFHPLAACTQAEEHNDAAQREDSGRRPPLAQHGHPRLAFTESLSCGILCDSVLPELSPVTHVRTFLVPRADHVVPPGRIPSFSIVIPAYQAAAHIGRAVESVLA